MKLRIRKFQIYSLIVLKLILSTVVVVQSISPVRAQNPPVFYSEPEPVLMVNSPDSESYLYVSADDSKLIFTKEKSRSNVGGNKNPGDLWFADFLKPVVIDSLKSRKFNSKDVFNAPIGYNEDQSIFYYSETKLGKGIYEGRVMQMSTSDGFKSEVEIPFFKNQSPIQTGFISRDGKFMLLSLETTSGYGVEDLYVSINEDGRWTAPTNLGFTINTDKQELTPFLAEDNKTLYFATNAREGKGSFDIYYATRLDNTWRNWSQPKNLGDMVNTQGSEMSFMYNPGSEYAYFTSTQNSDGYSDVKRIRIYPTENNISNETAKEVIEEKRQESYSKTVTFQVQNAKTGLNLPFQYVGEMMQTDASVQRLVSSGVSENYTQGLNEGDSLIIEFKSKGYLSETVNIGYAELVGASTQQVVSLQPLELGNVILLKNVLFTQGSDNFLENSERSLDLVVEMMNDNPEVRILLKGHTDNVGNKVMNIQLSQMRVNKVKDYLVSSGIDAGRISGIGYGGSKPITDNRTEETRKPNRRVEFEVVK